MYIDIIIEIIEKCILCERKYINFIKCDGLL